MKSTDLIHYLDDLLGIPDFPDYSGAWNGVQVQPPATIQTVTTAVDACAVTSHAAAAANSDLLIVHHGMLWAGTRPFVGDLFAQLRDLIQASCGLYSAHLPLDGHAEFGNNAILAQRLGLIGLQPFGDFKGTAVGFIGQLEETSAEAASEKVGIQITEIVAPASKPKKLAVVSGSAGSCLQEAYEAGAQILFTGEVDHHCRVLARDLGMGIWTGGHYATETWGVRALGEHLQEKFDISHIFLDHPTGG